ncbi:1-aminocyclopropane-1-carboxylate deaminase/D-cysteine desulfhydrase [Microbulbifer sediminum]|uniref:1-aminocyclopropane-1-carboxylate deaminase/D-cysteine desulfhydrase n=1 Tax=Microbulbifer sediminum TaxID=2904250 RepID=UPI001F2DA449|nr:pyridoxal-phosphate dependent enzyme [Microbulbifer sediminum]
MTPRYLTRFDPGSVREATLNVPYQRLHSSLFPEVEVWMRRDDLLDPLISGNKAYKLVYNVQRMREQGLDAIITCGGAWSNHIHATAAAGRRFGFRTLGVIRGARPKELSATLQDAERLGMKLHFVTRAEYRRRYSDEFLSLAGLEQYRAHFIPEGGSNREGLDGLRMLGEAIEATAPVVFDQVWLPCGTGVSLAGLQVGLGKGGTVGVPVLKAEGGIQEEALRWLRELDCPRIPAVLGGYHCGGYARQTTALRALQRYFEADTGIPLEPVYMAKLVYALSQHCSAGKLQPGSRVLLIHTGGLQGRRGFAPAIK